jgi:hypothetical protein
MLAKPIYRPLIHKFIGIQEILQRLLDRLLVAGLLIQRGFPPSLPFGTTSILLKLGENSIVRLSEARPLPPIKHYSEVPAQIEVYM